MTLELAKQELVKRYKYLYENAYFILAPYMYEQSEQEFRSYLIKNYSKKDSNNILKKPLIYLKINRLDYINSLFEEFLLSEKPTEESSLYKMIESKKVKKIT